MWNDRVCTEHVEVYCLPVTLSEPNCTLCTCAGDVVEMLSCSAREAYTLGLRDNNAI